MSARTADSNGERPTVVSLFAGCGGSSLGYRMAGFRELLAVEWDAAAAATFRLNFHDVPVHEGDVRELTAERCMKMVDVKPGELDVLDSSPPCQGFSMTGKRRFLDPRNSLAMEVVRLAAALRPKVVIMENVKGLIRGAMRRHYLATTAALRAAGYKVKGQVLNAMWFGVPQSRERVIIIAVRNDLQIAPSHPKPGDRPISVRESLQDIDQCAHPYPSGKVRAAIAKGWGPRSSIEGNSAYRKKWRSTDVPAPTLQASRPLLVRIGNIIREMTVSEASALQTFPDHWKWPDQKHAHREIGNSVPPLMMKAIAEHVRNAILDKNA